ncbi:unnamed protein product [Adineta steineri]|uniref:Uncharacterized protein n=1 Tax=Adineta steineri TaxID=433720 RepID=A0A815P2H6_9BILA|nr:unnamed protein product [Adineta steineri]CAF1628430.1 unnamed protein product [Adineta steineri]
MRLFPNKIITYRILDLIHLSSNENIKNSDICVSIEINTNSRRFCYLTINELITLYQNSPVLERSLYELISPNSKVKAYIDFEYYIDNNPDIQNSQIGISCCLKMLHLFLNSEQNIEPNKYTNLILKQFLVLES